MALSKETSDWLADLKKEGGLDDAALATISGALGEKGDGFVKGSVLRQSDYSRQSAEIQKAKKDAEDALRGVSEKETALNKFQGELGTWKSQAEGSFQKALADKEAADLRAQKVLARLSTVQAKYGIPDEDVKLEDVVIPEKKEAVGPKYVTEEDLRNIVGRGTREAGLLDATLYDLGTEHQRLFGTALPKASILVQEALAAGVPLSKYWSDKYKVEDRERALSEEQYQSRLKGDVETEVAKRLSAANLPGGPQPGNLRTDLQGSPVFQKKLEVPVGDAGGSGVSAAIAAFNVGKHSVVRGR